LTYYVVAQMGQTPAKGGFAIDYTLGTIFLVYYLLFKFNYLSKIDLSGSFNLLLNSYIDNKTVSINRTNIQSAENCKGFSETIRQLSNTDSENDFYDWFAGIIDGDGNFDIRKDSSNRLILKAIRIKLHNRDVRILTRIQNYLHIGAWWCRNSFLCLKLSNSGNTLKLLIPSYIWKIISGWINYSCMEIIQKIIERAIGYRGSKLVTCESVTVKEQRADGSYCNFNFLQLRCALMDFERNYQIKIPSKQIYKKTQIRSFHTTRVVHNLLHNDNTQVIHPLLRRTGFIDGEGSFLVIIRKNKNLNIGWNVELRFHSFAVHYKDINLLYKIKEYFGVGFVNKEREDVVKYRVHSIKDLSVIISHLENFPLITQKRADYLIFKPA